MERRPGDGRPISTSPAATWSPVMQLVALDHADREADQVELAGLHGAGVLGHLAADQRAAGLAAALGHPRDQLLDVVGVELADRDVVEEEQRLGALADQVVDAHGHQVDADGVEPPDGLGDQGLGARRRRWRTPAPGRGSGALANANSPPKPPMSPMTSGRKVERTLSLMRSTASSPAAMSTPGGLVGLTHSVGVPPALVGRQQSAGSAEARRAAGGLQHGRRSAAAGRRPRARPCAARPGPSTGYSPVKQASQNPAPGAPVEVDQPVEGQVGQRVDVEVVADLLDLEVGGQQLGPRCRCPCRRSTASGTGGEVMRRCTSAAPASRSICTSWRCVVPRTIESSTTTSRLPVDVLARAG